jgi:small-conductance mechanosensitive channel
VRRLWDRIPPLVRGLGIVAIVAVIVVVLSLEPVVATVGGILRISFFLAIAFILFIVWRERRDDIDAWSERNRRLFYASIVLAVIAVGLVIGFGLRESRDALALILALAGCAYVIVRVWRLEHRY